MTSQEIEQAAQALYDAERSCNQIGHLSKAHPGIDKADAYAVQAAFVRRKLADGRRIIGWKIGLTSKAMQAALGIDTPDSGVLLDDMLFDNCTTIPAGRFIEARIEAEIAFIMKAPLAGPAVTRDQVLAATKIIMPALEILDTRILRTDPQTGEPRKVFDTIADNAANAGLVLGDERQDPQGTDMRRVGAIVYRNGEVEETGLGAGVLDDPAVAIAWLADRLAEQGQSIRAGDVVLSGSFVRPVEARSGDVFVADYGEFGSVRCKFG